MKRLMIAFCIAPLFFSCNSGENAADKKEEVKTDTTVTTTATTKSEEWVPVDSATAMKSMMEAGTPGPQHAMLAKSDGKWKAETTMWMAPGAPPVTGKATAENKMLYGGRYQQTSFKGDFMGMPYEGGGVTGYDNSRKVFFTTWMDNMSTMIMNMEGTWDDATKSITFKGKMFCPANGKECTMREVCTFTDDNNYKMEMYGPDMQTGKEFKNMEIKMTRNK
ncbi:MAG: DUF1579 domain-containing protein [Ferruginibacter sp.]